MAAPDVALWLGGKRLLKASIHTELELAEAVREGLPVRVVDELVARGALSTEELERLVIPRRTLAHRRQKRQRLSREESDRLTRIARAVAHAEDVLGDVGTARDWLRRPNRALEGRRPLETLDTDGGARAVEAVLERAAHGVYS